MMNLFSIGRDVKNKRVKKSTRKPIIISKIGSSGIAYGLAGSTISRTSFEKSEYNLGEVAKVMDIEAYVRQAFDKHVELAMKEGYEISSRSEDATKYIKKRLREMAESSDLTFDMLLRTIMQNLVAYSNAFIVKVRDLARSSGMPIRKMIGEPLIPIAAYFPLDPTSIQIKRNYHGKVLRYQQKIPGNPHAPEFRPENMIHIYYDRKVGFAFGTPYIIPTLDDIRSLRRMEENIEMLISQHLFPLYQYIVGTEENPAETYDDGTTEVDVIKDQIENMPTEGSIVTPERHTIHNLGAEGKALEASKYLIYFEKRVLAGLGMSEIALGRGGTANRATASVIDKMMQDRCKDFQDVTEGFVNEYMFKELLFEGGFTIDEAEDNFVKLKFKEIDIDSMLKVENHSVFKYEHDAITETEVRELLGHDPITEEQRADMYFERVAKPKAIIMAIDEPYTAEAKAGGAIKKVSKEEKKKRDTANREKPTNQHGTKPAKTRQKKDELLEETLEDIQEIKDKENEKRVLLISQLSKKLLHYWRLTQQDVIDYIKELRLNEDENWKDITVDNFNIIFALTKDSVVENTLPYIMNAFRFGAEAAFPKMNKESKLISIDPEFLKDRVEECTQELLKDLGEQLIKYVNTPGPRLLGLIPTIVGVFDALRYKIDLISSNEVKKAYNFGYTLAMEEKAKEG